LNAFVASNRTGRKIRWIAASQSEELGRYAPWLKSIEELAQTRPFDWIGEPASWYERDWHTKTIVGMPVTRQHAVRDDLVCYAFPADELPPESRAGASQELWALSLQFSLPGHFAYFAIEPLNRGYSGGEKFELITQDPAWYWSRKAEFYREARLARYDGCMVRIVPGKRPLSYEDLKGRECLMYGIQAHDFINSICCMYIREFSTLGVNDTSAQQWYDAVAFWVAMRESSSWQEVWEKVVTPNYEQHTVDSHVMDFFNNHFTHPWGEGWETVEYFFDWVASILPSCDIINVEGL